LLGAWPGYSFAGTLSVKIVDETGSACPARIYLTDAKGEAKFAPGTIVYNKSRGALSERHFVPPTGAFLIELSGGQYQLRIERGKEYFPLQRRLDVPSVGLMEEKLQLRRWIRMNGLGWYSADMHAHGALKDLTTLELAEDLNVVLPITRWRSMTQPVREDPDLADFLRRSDSDGVFHVGKNRWFPVVNEELEAHWAALLVSRLGRLSLPLEYPLPKYGETAHARGALVDSEKATSYELPVIAAVGACDFVGLANNHFWRAGYPSFHWGTYPDNLPRRYPDTCAGYASAGFDIYYALLSMGFPIKLSAGSANAVHPVPMGWSRIYVHVNGEVTPPKWFDALKKGRSFVTTGPMLLLQVNGLVPGDEVRTKKFPVDADVEVVMYSQSPVASAELVVNGIVHRIPLVPDRAQERKYHGKLRLTLKNSSWIAARWLAEEAENCSIAHTSPLYFWNADQSLPVRRADTAYLLDHVEKLLREIRTGKSEAGAEPTTVISDTDELRREQLQYAERAREIYRKKLDGEIARARE
jgi:hypothetical protein